MVSKQNIAGISTDGLIPLSVPHIKGNEWKYIKECLDANWVSSAGEFVGRFEQKVADFIGRKYAVACVNGTSSLHVALLLAGIKPEEEVLLPALTFVATANAVRYTGAWPVFIDVEPDTWQMNPQKVQDFLINECDYSEGRLINCNTKRVVRAILPVHLLGHPVDIDPILKVAQRFGLKVIEDAAESLGAFYKDQKVGALGDIACFSFNGNKIITSGGGGMIATDNEEWAKKARYLTTQALDDPIEHIHNQVGYNYRLTNLQAAMGVAQMECLEDFIEKKRGIACRYSKNLEQIAGIKIPQEAKWAKSTFWLYTILINKDAYGISSRELLHKLKEANIQTRPLWHPLHSSEPFKNSYAYKIEVVDKLYREALSLPCSVGLTLEQQDKVIQTINFCAASGGG